MVLGKMETNLENKHSVTDVDSGQNCKAKTSLNLPCNGICDTFNRLVMNLWSLDLFLY